ncbi:hypothetical protein AcV7_008085 [Taiwanofungus camphoratus]|nr:hypothetical protein AcV7_008085 [Antrodia cinnamomea]
MADTENGPQTLATLTDEATKAITRRVLWKLDIHVLPPLALLWLANFLDRTNIGNANIAGLPQDLHLHGTQFNTALSVFYVSYILVELPSNWILKKMKASRWLPILVAVWGIVTTLSGLVEGFSGLIAIRFFLGFCEGGLLPGITLYLSTLYKRHELQQRIGIFYASASLSGAFGGSSSTYQNESVVRDGYNQTGLLASAILKMQGIAGLAGWRWIFILEGIATIIIAIISAIFLPADIKSASFFTSEEREFALHRYRSDAAGTTTPLPVASQLITGSIDVLGKDTKLKAETSVTQDVPQIAFQEDEEFEWGEVVRGIRDPQVWMTSISYLGYDSCLYSFSLFLPTIVAGLGYSGEEAQLHTVPPYVPATFLTVVVAVASDRLKWRGPFILICLPLAAIGYIIAIAAQNNTQRYVAVFLIATGIYPCGPCILSILPNNNAGHYKKATTVALQLAIANTG